MRLSPLLRSLFILLPALLLFPATTTWGQATPEALAATMDELPAARAGEDILWIPFEEALVEAKEKNQKILVFVYTDWCGWCRKMLDSTFTAGNVYDLMSDSFSTVRLDAEGDTPVELEAKQADGAPIQSVTEAQLAMALGASGFPTTVFLESDGKYITRLPSYLPADDYYNVLRYIGEDLYKTQSFEEYINGLSGG